MTSFEIFSDKRCISKIYNHSANFDIYQNNKAKYKINSEVECLLLISS